MSAVSSTSISDDRDEYPAVTQADLDRSTFRIGRKPAPRKQRITISLDTGLIEYFKAKAGSRGYQTLINQALREYVGKTARSVDEDTLRRVIREELQAV